MRLFPTILFSLLCTQPCTQLCIQTATADSPAAAKSMLQDHFTESSHDDRKPLRGDWKVSDGVIAVTQDDALYEKHKNHGPLLQYEIPHDDAEARVEFKAHACKSVVFTMDAETGHAFRIIMTPQKLGSVYGYDPQPNGERPKANPLTREIPKLMLDHWTSLRTRVVGDTAEIEIDGMTFNVSHPSLDQPKKIVKIGFAFGSFEVRKFELAEAK